MRPANRLARILPLLALLALVIASAGCASRSTRGGFPADAGIRFKGGDVPLAAWQALPPDAFDGQARPRSESHTFWLLPFSMYVGTAEFATTETMQTTSVAWNDILFPIVALPLRMRYSEHYYIDTQEEPAAYRRLNWNLLWASASSKGLPPGHGEFRARGVPLVFSMVDWVGQTGLEVGMWNLLWTLGPFYMHFDLDPEEFAGIQEGGVNASGYSRAKGYMGTPLLLGGPIGSLVWFDVSVRSETETSRSLTSLHGPLFGSAGYMRFLEEKADGSLSHSRKLLYGILWSDRSEREAGDPSSWHASHGPLWGMIGWGKKRGKNTVRLLWLPIVLPFQDDVPGPDAGSNAE